MMVVTLVAGAFTPNWLRRSGASIRFGQLTAKRLKGWLGCRLEQKSARLCLGEACTGVALSRLQG